MNYKTREEWLMKAVELLKPCFKKAGYTIPKTVRVSVGWPSGRGKKTLGECWSDTASAGKFREIFITPKYDKADVTGKAGVLATLVHELCHATVGNKCGHKGAFKQIFKKVGLAGPVKASHADDHLQCILIEIAKKLGKFPHRAISPASGPAKKQTTRLIKVGCLSCDYIARVTRVHLDDKGAPLCPIHKKPFEELE